VRAGPCVLRAVSVSLCDEWQRDAENVAAVLPLRSWACVEVPRYLFYALNIYMDTVPFVLFFLRYNLFFVLYPSGISGE
jgi:very-long-chain (3R)-3-hydroxyacyl-CoA dehydratase